MPNFTFYEERKHAVRNLTPETFLPIDKVGEFWYNNCDDDWKNARPSRPSPPLTALLKPLRKKCGLDIAFHNFSPVSNLPYVSRLSEKAAANQLIDHMTTNDLHMPLQSTYKQNQ